MRSTVKATVLALLAAAMACTAMSHAQQNPQAEVSSEREGDHDRARAVGAAYLRLMKSDEFIGQDAIFVCSAGWPRFGPAFVDIQDGSLVLDSIDDPGGLHLQNTLQHLRDRREMIDALIALADEPAVAFDAPDMKPEEMTPEEWSVLIQTDFWKSMHWLLADAMRAWSAGDLDRSAACVAAQIKMGAQLAALNDELMRHRHVGFLDRTLGLRNVDLREYQLIFRSFKGEQARTILDAMSRLDPKEPFGLRPMVIQRLQQELDLWRDVFVHEDGGKRLAQIRFVKRGHVPDDIYIQMRPGWVSEATWTKEQIANYFDQIERLIDNLDRAWAAQDQEQFDAAATALQHEPSGLVQDFLLHPYIFDTGLIEWQHRKLLDELRHHFREQAAR